MEREKEIRAIGVELLKSIIVERPKEIQDYVSKHRDFILGDFQKKIKLLFQRAYELQQQNQKEAIQFFSISYLQRCVYTKKYEMHLELYNHQFYFDKQKTGQDWDMNFLFQFFEEDITYFREKIYLHIRPLTHPLQEYEEKAFALWYIRHYYKIAESFFRDQIETILENREFAMVEKEDVFFFLYGGYIEEQSILFQLGNEGRGIH